MAGFGSLMMDQSVQEMSTKTGTSTLGITYRNGVVIGADHRATMGNFIANKNVQKLFLVSDRIALTTAGLVGHAQRLARMLRAEIALYELKREIPMTVKVAATMMANVLSNRPHWVQLLIAGCDDDGGHVYSIDSAGGSIPDVFSATGSGSPFMYGVLEDGFKENMSKDEALTLAARSLRASSQRDSASGDGMDLCVISSKGAEMLTRAEIETLIKSL